VSQVTFAKSGWTTLLDALLGGLVPYVHLYTNNVTPTQLSVRGDFTEVAFTGYHPVAATRWTPAAIRRGLAFSVVDPVIFAFGGGAVPPTVRGYFVTAGEDGPLLWAWKREGAGFQFSVETPLLTLYLTMMWPTLAEA